MILLNIGSELSNCTRERSHPLDMDTVCVCWGGGGDQFWTPVNTVLDLTSTHNLHTPLPHSYQTYTHPHSSQPNLQHNLCTPTQLTSHAHPHSSQPMHTHTAHIPYTPTQLTSKLTPHNLCAPIAHMHTHSSPTHSHRTYSSFPLYSLMILFP